MAFSRRMPSFTGITRPPGSTHHTAPGVFFCWAEVYLPFDCSRGPFMLSRRPSYVLPRSPSNFFSKDTSLLIAACSKFYSVKRYPLCFKLQWPFLEKIYLKSIALTGWCSWGLFPLYLRQRRSVLALGEGWPCVSDSGHRYILN